MSDIDFSTCDCSNSISNSLLSSSTFMILNIFLHITILFIFLYFLYTFIIVDISINAFKSEISHIIHDNITANIPSLVDLQKYAKDYNYKISLLNNLNNNFGLSADYNILLQENSDAITAISNAINSITTPTLLDNYIQVYSKPNYVIGVHNNNTLSTGLNIIFIFSILTILLIATVKVSCGLCTNVTKLVIENVLTFIFVGGLEYWFFMTYAVNFIPAPPSLLMSTAINSIKENLST